MNALTKSLERSRAVVNTAHAEAMQLKEAGGLLADMSSSAMGDMGHMQDRTKDRYRYSQFRGWTYSAINALASKAAGQPINVGRLLNPPIEREEERKRLATSKAYYLGKMTGGAFSKAVNREIDILEDHPLLLELEQPNPFQYRWQFVYTFVANLNLTGWAYIIRGEFSGKMEYYSLPTTWVRPNKDFTLFKIVNPKDQTAGADVKPLDRENVSFAYLPNPADPLSALSPTASQMAAVRIDDHIQTSQEGFFEKGVFPSVIITLGKYPHQDVQGGVRPILTAAQRRQVIGAVNKTMAGTVNYGAPLIADGVIEGVERLSATQTEMGWDKSEDKVRDRILSAFGVPPFILGKNMPGSYAQAYEVKRLFCERVNTFLDMLGTVMTSFVGMAEEDNSLLVWWDKCEPVDPSIASKEWLAARKNEDITQNEYRAKLGFPPIEEEAKRSKLLETVGGMTGVKGFFDAIRDGSMKRDQLVQLMVEFFQITEERATEIVGKDIEETSPEQSLEVLQEAVRELQKPVQVEFADSGMEEMMEKAMKATNLAREEAAGIKEVLLRVEVQQIVKEAKEAIGAIVKTDIGGNQLAIVNKALDDLSERAKTETPIVQITNSPIGIKQIAPKPEKQDAPVQVFVNPTPIIVEPPIINVPVPDIKVEPKIDVQVPPAEVTVKIEKDEILRHGKITHPDETISQVELLK